MAATTELKKIPENVFQECIESWKRRMHKCFKVEGDYFEGILKECWYISTFFNKVFITPVSLLFRHTSYTTRSASRRWPVAVWGNILDIAAINSYVLYKNVTNERITRRQFILMLVENLQSLSEPCPSNSNRQFRGNDEGVRKRRKCQGVCCDNKRFSTCILCQKPTCGKCSQDNFRVTHVKSQLA